MINNNNGCVAKCQLKYPCRCPEMMSCFEPGKSPTDSSSGLATGYVPRVLNEADTLRLIVLCVKHVDRNHHDWEEVCQLVQKFDESNVSN